MKHILFILLLFSLLCPSLSASDARVEHAGNGRYIVRVDCEGKYILLPIEDAAPECEVRLLADAKMEMSVHVRLAMNHIDYYMPLDVSSYKERNVILDVR
ncbi:MAG: DUF4980 domain-containing protein, partial [Prevotellaceae bacterium]|nr:DUF4980 domain-containing protein [Prevotellaceae bacterium]